MKNLRLGLLGGFALEPAEQIGRVPKKAKALLAFLALEPGVSVSRARLAALLWDTQGERQARQSLRQALTDLRKVIPDAGRFLEVSADAAAVRPGLLDVDARELLMLDPTSVAALECVLALYRGDLLEGLDTRAAPFEEWRALDPHGCASAPWPRCRRCSSTVWGAATRAGQCRSRSACWPSIHGVSRRTDR